MRMSFGELVGRSVAPMALGLPSQCLRNGLTYVAPPALGL